MSWRRRSNGPSKFERWREKPVVEVVEVVEVSEGSSTPSRLSTTLSLMRETYLKENLHG
jgi:hypothetical protein